MMRQSSLRRLLAAGVDLPDVEPPTEVIDLTDDLLDELADFELDLELIDLIEHG